ncbi:lytic enzyme [Serratia sp. AS12]|uniref:glycoside hydrolase family 19 protein n=1 Tax=Serratia TaxID=613 RepID=UPI00020EA0B3|nr:MULTISPECIES: glycoside hydrolase family 19 protein [Serratia]AEF45819.1 lytic enzyme [Serratia plymuthica AS9]AEF50770.1 lytic enzyme [Serratia sp. AS12]AEG28477.1 lytic enzyme [Serratia sp. AS13]UTN94577.1 glycoside hydrolase family 19 protein [Serratia plymuthica]
MTQDQFQRAAGISAELAARWFKPITAAMAEFGVTTPVQQAMFIAQTGHESVGFKRLAESFDYTPAALLATFGSRISRDQASMLGRTADHPARQEAIANLVYQGRYGNKLPGDGWKFRGHGLIQITFLDNHKACGKALGLDLVANPELLMVDVNAARSAGWYWQSRSIALVGSDVREATKRINPAMHGLDQRRERFERARAALL